jgi:hypothetical protein
MRALRFAPALLLLVALPRAATAGTLTDARASAFVDALVQHRDSLPRFVDPEELAVSGRLGIIYDGVDQKFLISYDLDARVRSRILPPELRRTIDLLNPESDVSRLTLTLPRENVHVSFLFHDSMLISPIRQATRNWSVRDSHHFRFFISDTAQFNPYCVDNLERFLARATVALGCNQEQMDRIAAQKLYYVLCADDEEMLQLTDYHARGMYNLAYDYVVTTYQAHYHELVHQLVNIKLGTLPLFTHPFLQEGLAVALGGRGGKEPDPILDLGRYLAAADILDYHDLLSADGFRSLDASMSYPLAGLYNEFLLQHLGVDRYLELYRRHSGTAAAVDSLAINAAELPADSAWQAFLAQPGLHATIVPGDEFDSTRIVCSAPDLTVTDDGDYYGIVVADTALLQGTGGFPGYRSRQFKQLFPHRAYHGEEYAILTDVNEISIYNLYTNNLIAKFVGAFADPPVTMASVKGRYRFRVLKSVFDGALPGRK